LPSEVSHEAARRGSTASSSARPASSRSTLDRLLVRLNANKSELLRVLDRPEISLHTTYGSEKRHPQPRHQAQGQRWQPA